jgi:hypothetical protein
MAVLQASEYDISYFDGRLNENTHPAGYTEYGRVQFNQFSTKFVPTLAESTGNLFGDLCKGMNINLNNRFVGKTLLILGAAYGFEVKGFRDLGIDAWGVEVSPYAISKAEPAIQPYLINQNALTYLPTQARNGWDYIFSRTFLECFSDADLATLITQMNRVSRSEQVHIVYPASNPAYYNSKTLAQLALLPFDRGTILIQNDDLINYVTV